MKIEVAGRLHELAELPGMILAALRAYDTERAVALGRVFASQRADDGSGAAWLRLPLGDLAMQLIPLHVMLQPPYKHNPFGYDDAHNTAAVAYAELARYAETST